ncbi:alpha/beta hydrolase-fold protein [Pseudanabaena sp. FACHB-2040]|uniref:alpha/beta hydrolase-fold protein n=1 Tax=Pseudanabaena sp. FACHB-2040 TaxID=2692859 RepID=UPI0018EF743D
MKSTRNQTGQLFSRPSPPTEAGLASGLHSLGLESERDGLIYVPKNYQPGSPAPLVLMLHGAGGDAERALRILAGLADDYGLLLLAVESRGRTWDVIIRSYGPDIAAIDRALEQTFRRYAVDAGRVAIAGFSDGASYALSVGITNGDLFTHVIAFSPGFMVPATQQGEPRIFISHGTGDPVLPIDRCSRKIVPQLQQAGYDTRYREFEGGHIVPADLSREAMTWLTT